jgi:hypothetical protein
MKVFNHICLLYKNAEDASKINTFELLLVVINI